MVIYCGFYTRDCLCNLLRQRESMSNEDVLSELQKYGTDSTQTKETRVGLQSIYGPKAGPIAKPKVEDSENKSKNGTSKYPDIYGPDVAMTPGKGGVGSTSYFKINTDLEKIFPTDGAPEPYLTDLSSIQG